MKAEFNFGENVFTDEVMRKCISKETFSNFLRARSGETELTIADADEIANAMKEWALEKGATHYCHWFQPLNGVTAEKHDSFINARSNSTEDFLHFSGKNLIKGESDASSFPSGGIRSTFEARGYSVWDLSSPVFVSESSSGMTLYIPTAFCSYNGDSLDKKTPLLRSEKVLAEQTLRLLRIFGDRETEKVFPTVGAEQEYFIVDREKYLKREDLIFTGRTLFGAMPPKGQEMDDHYMGSIPLRVGAFMKSVNQELWKLGVPAKTEHNEAAPAQHELACNYEEANIATDHNQIVMEKLKVLAEKKGLVCLLHEKPFAGVNGSGKHNNWSLQTNTGKNLLHAGKAPHENLLFLLLFTCVMKAVDTHSELLMASAFDTGNAYRLGGNEAPPRIITMFTGAQLEDILKQYIKNGSATSSLQGEKLFTDIDNLAGLLSDATDRNRTSPFAFTGDKFEFRSVGSQDSIAEPNVVLNTIVAEALKETADRLEHSKNLEKDVHALIREYAAKHSRIVYNGDNYKEEWALEAKRRGLKEVPDMVASGRILLRDDVAMLYHKFGIYTKEELKSRAEIQFEKYEKAMHVEARTMIDMAGRQYIPAVIEAISKIAVSAKNMRDAKLNISILTQEHLIKEMAYELNETEAALLTLEKLTKEAESLKTAYERACFYREKVVPAMENLRKPIDRLELMTDKKLWPVPSYADLMYEV